MDNNPAKNASSERKLGNSWCIWEKYQEAYVQTTSNYDKNLFIIYTFDSLEKFALLWKHTTYSNPSRLFYDLQNDTTKKVVVLEGKEEEEKIVDGLFMFKQGVEPKWEDPANQKGSDIWCELAGLDSAAIDTFWRGLMFALIGENFPHNEYITGFRILDRMKKHRSIKFELWISCGLVGHKHGSEEYLKHQQVIDEITKYLHQIISLVTDLSIHSIAKKEHSVVNKVN